VKIRELREEMGIQWQGGAQGPWHPVFAWRPRKDIHGRWHWLKTVYRRERNIVVYPHQGYEYGNAFDVLKDTK
jgi:hypothetical protein